MSNINPMNMPEIIALVGRFLPLWKYSDRLGFYNFNPKFLISCSLVSKAWYHSLTPVIWYVYNGSVMRAIPKEIIIRNSHHFRILFYDQSFPGPFESRQLKELIIPWCDDKLAPLVEANAGTLQTLAWKGSESPVREGTLPTLDYNLFMRMAPTLQELQLSHWTLSGQSIVKFLASCKRLRKLSLVAIDWIDPTSACSGAFVDLVRSCPDLESFSLYSESSEDVRTLTPVLRDFCPKLANIEYVARFSTALNGYDYLSDSEYADLVQSARGLKTLKVDVPCLDEAMTKALILQSSTLVSLDLRFFKRRPDSMTDAENICKILRYCIHLRKLSLYFSPQALGNDETLRLFEDPWACVELETLELTDVTTTATTSDPHSNMNDRYGSGGQLMHPYQWRIDKAPRPVPVPIPVVVDSNRSRSNCAAAGGSLTKQKLFEQVRKLPKLATLSLNHVTYSL
ncbi:hypothetical protein BGX31_011649 [Mortierella sp. GBA43]|nr:hypothetical protein BGX31_011649 [Mortierella sp. GBA43]